MPEDNTKLIKEEHLAVAGPLCDAFKNLGMVPGFYDDEEVVFVCRFDELNDDADKKAITPLFIVLTGEMHKKCLNAVGEEPEGLDDKLKKFSARILWGQDHEPVEYEFATKAELEAFLLGVQEGSEFDEYEYLGYEEVPPPDETMMCCNECGKTVPLKDWKGADESGCHCHPEGKEDAS